MLELTHQVFSRKDKETHFQTNATPALRPPTVHEAEGEKALPRLRQRGTHGVTVFLALLLVPATFTFSRLTY